MDLRWSDVRCAASREDLYGEDQKEPEPVLDQNAVIAKEGQAQEGTVESETERAARKVRINLAFFNRWADEVANHNSTLMVLLLLLAFHTGIA
jgi:hypothetical protein